jgi:hypothetical protein
MRSASSSGPRTRSRIPGLGARERRGNELLRARHLGEELDIITSQPSHPWRSGAEPLHREYFRLARES